MLNTAEATPATTQPPVRIVRIGKWRLFQLSRIASLCSAEDMAYPPRSPSLCTGMLSRLSSPPGAYQAKTGSTYVAGTRQLSRMACLFGFDLLRLKGADLRSLLQGRSLP